MREFATSPIVRAVNRVGYMLCAAGVAMLAACGGDDVDVAPTTSAVVVTTMPPVNETTTTVSSTEISEAVFAAMSDGSAEALASVTAVVTPGSIYLRELDMSRVELAWPLHKSIHDS